MNFFPFPLFLNDDYYYYLLYGIYEHTQIHTLDKINKQYVLFLL